MNPPSKVRKVLGIACLVVATLILMTPTYGVSANGGLFGLSFDRGQNSWQAPDHPEHPDVPDIAESPDYSGPLDDPDGSDFPDPPDNPEGSERHDD